MSDGQLDIEFRFNTSEAKRNLSEIQQGTKAVNETAKEGNKPFKEQEGLLERLKRRTMELRQKREEANSVLSVSKINRELQLHEKEIIRVTNAGKQGFDQYGNSIVSQEGILQRLQRAATLYQKGMQEATRVENIEKYSQKLALVNAEMNKLTKGQQIGGSSHWNGMQNSINQMARELPAFTYSAQTGIMALTNNFPIFIDEINRARLANEALNASGQKGVTVWKQVIGGFLSWQTAMMVGITLLSVYGKEIGAFFIELFKGKQAINQAKTNFEALNSVISETSKQAGQEIAQLKILSTVASDVTKTTKERKEAVKQLQELGKAHNVQLQTEAILAGNAAAQYRDLAKSILEAARSKAAQSKIEENESKRIELEFQKQKVRNANANEKARYKRQGDDKDVTISNGSFGTSTIRGMTVAEKQTGSDIRAYRSIKEIDAGMEVLDKTNAFLMKFVKVEDDVKKATAKGGGSTANLYGQLSNSSKDLLDKIAKLDAEYSRKALDSDGQELQALRDKFNEFRKLIEDENEKIRQYNEKNKKDIPLLNVGAIDPIEQRATSDVLYRQDTERHIKALNEQKALYLEYEQYKNQTSSTQADKRFANDLGKVKNYYANLTGEINALQSKDVESGLSGVESERLQKLLELLKEYNRNKQAEEDKAFLESFNITKTYNEKLQDINDKYQKLFLAQEESLTEEKKRLLIQAKQDEIDQLNETESKKNRILIESARRQLVVTTAGIRASIQIIKDLLAREDLDPKFRNDLENLLSNSQTTAKLGARAATLVNLKKEYKRLSDELVRLNKVGANPAEIKEVNDKLSETQERINQLNEEGLADLFRLLQQISQSVGQLGDSFSNLGDAFNLDALSGAGDLLSGLAGGIDKLSVAFDKNASSSDKYAAAIGAAVDMISMIANASAERKRAEEEYYRAMIDLQHEYNLSLNDQLRLQSQMGESLYVKDYVGRMKDGMIAAEDAIKNYKKAVEDLAKNGKVANGLKNAVDWKNVGSGAVSGAVIGGVAAGALTGAVAGSVVPIIGTVIGAAVGALIGIFAGKKKKPKYEDLWTQIPKDLANILTSTEPKDLSEVKSLLEKLNNDQAVDKNTKQMIEGVLDWIKKIEEARAQIKEVVQELTGSLGTDMRNNLVEYFKQGEDAAKAMGKSVEKILEDMMSQLLFSKAFDELFKQFEEELTDTLLFGDEGDIIDLFGRFLKDAGKAGNDFYKWLDMAKSAASGQGMNIFQSTQQDDNSSISGRINRTISEDTASAILGFERARYDLAKMNYQSVQKALDFNIKSYESMLDSILVQEAIERNTAETVRILKDEAIPVLKEIKTNTGVKVVR